MTASVFGQRISEEQLQIETFYIEATRARLLGNYEEAIELYKKILDKEDDNDVVYYELAKAYLDLELPKEALDAIQHAIDLNSGNIWYQEELAAAHAANDDFIAAAQVYEGLVKQLPREEKFYFDLAFYYVKNNDIKEAISTLDLHESTFGVSEEVVGRKFNLYKTLDNANKAEQELIKLVKAFPNQITYAIGLAKFYEDTNNFSKAKSTYRDILKQFPDHTESAVALERLDSGKKSDKDLESEIWADQSVNIDLKIGKLIPAITALETAPEEKKTQLIRIGKTLTETHPNEAKAFAVLGDMLNFSNQTQEAASAYESALNLEKNIYSVWDQLNSIYFHNYQIEKLFNNTEEALDYFPNEPKIYYLNGFAANETGDFNIARSSLTQANLMTNSLPGLNARIKVELAYSYIGLGKMQESENLFKELLSNNSLEVDLLDRIAWISLSSDAGISQAEKIILEILPEHQNKWQLLLTAGLLDYKQEKYREAKSKLYQSVELAPKGAYKLIELLGDTEYQLGNIEAAVEHWKKSKNQGNPSRELSKKISSRQI